MHFVESGASKAAQPEHRPGKSRKNSISIASSLAQAPHHGPAVNEHIVKLQDQLAKLSTLTGAVSGASKASKAERGAHYPQKKSRKAQLHESGQFSPTTSKLIKHFLSKQKLTSALTGTLGSEKKSISRKTSFLHHRDATPHASHQQALSRKHKEQHH